MEQARESGDVVVGCRPVTDTIKVVSDSRVGATLDRDDLQREWLAQLPLTATLESVFLVHATAEAPDKWHYLTDERMAEVAKMLEDAGLIEHADDAGDAQPLVDQCSRCESDAPWICRRNFERRTHDLA